MKKKNNFYMKRKKLLKKWPLLGQLITEGNKRLANAVSKTVMNEIVTACALICSAQKRFDSIQKSITSVQERHANLLGKQKKYEDLYKETKKV